MHFLKKGDNINSKDIIKHLRVKKNPIGINLCLFDLKSKLTKRQFQILKLKLQNYKNIDVAKTIKMCPGTITKEIKKIKLIVREYVR